MIEQFEYKGIWWLPDGDEGKIAGTLSFSPDKGIVLDLIGSFEGTEDMTRFFIRILLSRVLR